MENLAWALVAPSLWRKELIHVLPPSSTSYILHSTIKCAPKKINRGQLKLSDAVALTCAPSLRQSSLPIPRARFSCGFCWAQASESHPVSDLRLAGGPWWAGGPWHCLTPGGLRGTPRVPADSLPRSYACARPICEMQQQHTSSLAAAEGTSEVVLADTGGNELKKPKSQRLWRDVLKEQRVENSRDQQKISNYLSNSTSLLRSRCLWPWLAPASRYLENLNIGNSWVLLTLGEKWVEISESMFWHWSPKEQLNTMSLTDMWVAITFNLNITWVISRKDSILVKQLNSIIGFFKIFDLLASLCYFLSKSSRCFFC